MLRISSASNPRVTSALRALNRGERVPIEGARLLCEALDAGVAPEILFTAPDGAPEALRKRAESRGATVVEVTESVLERLSELSSTRGCVAIAPVPEPRLCSLPHRGLGLLLDRVQDPSNVGAIVRSAEAFGVDAVVTTEGSASPFTARSLRVSTGSAFRLPIAAGLPVDDAIAWARRSGALLAGAEAHGGAAPETVAGRRPLVLVIGSEGKGISSEVRDALEHRVSIALAGRAESLNAAAAAAVLLYAIASGHQNAGAASAGPAESPNTSAAKR